MDDAAALSRERQGRWRARPALQEPAPPSLDGGGPAREARHADRRRPLAGREAAIEAYLSITRIIDGGLANQVELDLASLEKKIGRTLGAADRATFREVQLQANRWTFLGSGMTHPNFLESVARVLPAASVQIEELAPAFSVHAHSEA
jgi:hypothetical protein